MEANNKSCSNYLIKTTSELSYGLVTFLNVINLKDLKAAIMLAVSYEILK